MEFSRHYILRGQRNAISSIIGALKHPTLYKTHEVPRIFSSNGARVLAIGLRKKYADMLRAGLSNLLI
jgi:hypothetical protein